MSQTASEASSSSNFRSVFNAALEAYDKVTKSKLLSHPLTTQLQSWDTPADILSVLQDLVPQFDQNRSGDERSKDWFNSTVSVLFTFSATLGEGVGLVYLNATFRSQCVR